MNKKRAALPCKAALLSCQTESVKTGYSRSKNSSEQNSTSQQTGCRRAHDAVLLRNSVRTAAAGQQKFLLIKQGDTADLSAGKLV
uniref:hypothetical protein n=1 Tax=Candidatus Electronema sp. TaxID=2698783 RepID=UPI004056CA4D